VNQTLVSCLTLPCPLDRLVGTTALRPRLSRDHEGFLRYTGGEALRRRSRLERLGIRARLRLEVVDRQGWRGYRIRVDPLSPVTHLSAPSDVRRKVRGGAPYHISAILSSRVWHPLTQQQHADLETVKAALGGSPVARLRVSEARANSVIDRPDTSDPWERVAGTTTSAREHWWAFLSFALSPRSVSHDFNVDGP